MKNLISNIIGILPIFLGPIFGLSVPVTLFDTTSLERYFTYLIALASWFAFQKLFVLYLFGDNKNKPSSYGRSLILSLIISTFFTLGILHLLQTKIESFVFYILLLALGSSLIAAIYLARNNFWAWFSAKFIFNITIGALSFIIITQRGDWQPFVVSVGFALMMNSTYLNRLLSLETLNQLGEVWIKYDFVLLKRLFAISLFSGPMVIVFLCFTNHLPRSYVLILSVLLIARELPSRYGELLRHTHRSSSKNDRESSSAAILKFRSVNSGIIAVMLLIVALLSTFS